MTPGARLQAAIELLDELSADSRPADRFMRAWFAQRRFIGSKDRRTIGRRVYTVLRSRARLDWWSGRHLAGAAPTNRTRVIASLVLTDGLAEGGIGALFDGGTYRPAPLTPDERTLVTALDGHMLDSAEQPDPVRGEYPAWLDDSLHRAFEKDVVAELQAFNRSAPLDLRVNTLKATRAEAVAALEADAVAAAPTKWSPLGLRLDEGVRLDNTRAYADGLIEVQDEGSQLVALLTEAAPGETIVDYCAGAGGKTLALAAMMAREGRLVACDSDQRRLSKMAPRLQRAGSADAVETRPLEPEGEGLADLAGRADRVLADVPCSTSGAWRRDPAAKWRLTPDTLDVYLGAQSEILDRAARLVRPGGLLVYATCSVLPEEDESQAEAFLARTRDFDSAPLGPAWERATGRSDGADEATIRLSPARFGTDGYFVAAFRRRAA